MGPQLSGYSKGNFLDRKNLVKLVMGSKEEMVSTKVE